MEKIIKQICPNCAWTVHSTNPRTCFCVMGEEVNMVPYQPKVRFKVAAKLLLYGVGLSVLLFIWVYFVGIDRILADGLYLIIPFICLVIIYHIGKSLNLFIRGILSWIFFGNPK